MPLRHVRSPVEAAATQSAVAGIILSRSEILTGWSKIRERAEAHGYMAPEPKAYDSAHDRICRIHPCLRFDNDNTAYTPDTKKKARNRSRAPRKVAMA